MAPSDHPARWRVWLLAIVIAGVGLLGRWLYYSGPHTHPDEVITVEVLRHMRQSGDWDTNWAKAALPPEFKYNQYNFASYFNAVYLSYRCIKAVPGTGAFRSEQEGFVLYRAFSVACSMAALLLTGWIGWRLGGPAVALASAALAAISPLLLQDAHYARPEAFVTALFASAILLSWPGDGRAPLRRIAAGGFVVGLLVACKVSFLLVAWVPLVALLKPPVGAPASSPALAPPGILPPWRIAASGAAILAIAVAAGFAAGAPHAVANPTYFLEGIHALRQQYAGLHPPHSHTDGRATADLLVGYLAATIGWSSLAALALALFDLGRGRGGREALLLGGPLALTLGYFCTRSVFFERNISHVIPLAAVLAGAGAVGGYRWCAAHIRSAGFALLLGAALVLILGVKPASVSARLVGLAFSGKDWESLSVTEEQIRREHPGAAFLEGSLFFPSSVDDLAKDFESAGKDGPRQAVYRHTSWGDDWTRPHEERLAGRFLCRHIGFHPSLFPDIPVCTLHTYLSPRVDYYLLESLKR